MSSEESKRLRRIFRMALERAVDDGLLEVGQQDVLIEDLQAITEELDQYEALRSSAQQTRVSSAPAESYLHRTESLVTEAERRANQERGEALAAEARQAIRAAEDQQVEAQRQRATLAGGTLQQIRPLAAQAFIAAAEAEYHRARLALGMGLLEIFKDNRVGPEERKKLKQLESEVQARFKQYQRTRASSMNW